MSDLEDHFKLLIFPTTSNAFSNYKPGLSSGSDLNFSTQGRSNTSSPPRKIARLNSDANHSSSVARTREKEKGTRRTKKSETHVVQTIRIADMPSTILTDNHIDDFLRGIHDSIEAILHLPNNPKLKSIRLSYEYVYYSTKTIVLFTNKSHWLFDKLRFELLECTKKVAGHLLSFVAQNSVQWLKELASNIAWFDTRIIILQDLLTYLDVVYLKQKPELPSISQQATNFFKTQVFQDGVITGRLIEGIKEWILEERTKRIKHSERGTIVKLLKALHEYSLFTPMFLIPYIKFIQDFYTKESTRLSSSSEKSESGRWDFLMHCHKRIEEETQRSHDVFSGYDFCWDEVAHTTEKALLTGRLEWLSKTVVILVDKKDIDGLGKMYNLFSRVDGLKLLHDAFMSHVQTIVEGVVKDTDHDDEMVERLLQFKSFIDKAVPLAFADPQKHVASGSSATQSYPMVPNKEFSYAATDGFRTGFRARRNKPAEMIAKYLDTAMRKGQKGASDEEFSKRLDEALSLYRFTNDKDVFRTFYHRALAKRLLLQRSASDDFEKAVLKRLKEQYDPEFSMGDNMFTDLALSRDMLREFHDRAETPVSAKKLSVMVLQRSFWPFSARQPDEILIPTSMQADLDAFTKFYTGTHQSRRLDFDHSLGTASLHAIFKSGDKELSVSLYQAVILLLFNQYDKLSYKDIQAHTRMNDADLRLTLQSLACGKKRVLTKSPPGRDVKDTDVFHFNAEFRDDRRQVHINSIQSKETPEESTKTQSNIEGDRKHYIDAAIVRIMKAKKTQKHQQLVSATIDAVKGHFVPDVRTIKERIEQLIESEYIRRDEEVDNVYVYVA